MRLFFINLFLVSLGSVSMGGVDDVYYCEIKKSLLITNDHVVDNMKYDPHRFKMKWEKDNLGNEQLNLYDNGFKVFVIFVPIPITWSVEDPIKYKGKKGFWTQINANHEDHMFRFSGGGGVYGEPHYKFSLTGISDYAVRAVIGDCPKF